MQRQLLYTKDVMAFTGKSERASRDLLKKIRKHYKKQSHHVVTVDEFCDYLGISTEKMADVLK